MVFVAALVVAVVIVAKQSDHPAAPWGLHWRRDRMGIPLVDGLMHRGTVSYSSNSKAGCVARRSSREYRLRLFKHTLEMIRRICKQEEELFTTQSRKKSLQEY